MRRRPFSTVLVAQSVLWREGLIGILRTADFQILDSGCSVSELDMSSLTQQQEPILLILHERDDSCAAVEQIALFKEHHANARVVILADRFRLNHVITAFQQGANAYLSRVVSCDAFIKSLELVMLGEMILPPAILSYILEHKNDNVEQQESLTIGYTAGIIPVELPDPESSCASRLSGREKVVLRCLIGGNSNKTIAREINIAEATVKVHIKAILRKIGVQNRTQAAIWAIKNGSYVLAANRAVATSEIKSAETVLTTKADAASPSNSTLMRKGIDRKSQ